MNSVDDYPTCLETYATLRIYHEHLDPDSLSRRLGLAPTESQVRGQLLNPGGRVPLIAPLGGWFLSTKSALESRDSQLHISWLLDRLGGQDEVLGQLRKEGYRMDISVSWLSAHGHGGPTLSPLLMSRMAAAGLE